ncbi:MAG: hypothetical protein Q9167_004658 [Letrouitia subvulpina]
MLIRHDGAQETAGSHPYMSEPLNRLSLAAAMASSQPGPSSAQDAAESVRSRASSVFSTGTKFSFATLATEDREQILEDTLARRTARFHGRPRSLLSVASSERPAPPYSEALFAPQVSPTQRDIPQLTRSASIPLSSSQTPSRRVPSDRSTPDPSTPTENTLAAEYSRIVRTIDENYAAELRRLHEEQDQLREELEKRTSAHNREIARLKQSHEQELASLRHSIDQAYRKDWKAKSREVEKIREEAAAHIARELEARDKLLEETLSFHATHAAQWEKTLEFAKQVEADKTANMIEAHHAAIARERHAIEDVWEARWRDRSRVEAEEKRRVEIQYQQRLDKSLAARDKKWMHEIELRGQEMLDDFWSVMGIHRSIDSDM